MPRPIRCRQIDRYPDYWSFVPEDAETDAEEISLGLDEYEVIRLIDRERLTQEQCAERMGVARTTVTAIYDSARGKLAAALVDGVRLRITGGAYQLKNSAGDRFPQKGRGHMRIAVTYENGEVFQHFGHTEQFKLYDIQDGAVVSQQIVGTDGTGHGALAGFLKSGGVDALICGGIGMGARNALAEAGIALYPGVSGDADAAAAALAAGSLAYDADATCDHHDHGEDHECGNGHGHGHGHGYGHGCGHGEGHGCGHGEGHGHGHGCGHHS